MLTLAPRAARVFDPIDVKRYKDPEWQADAFAGELLMPAPLIIGRNVEDISRMCGTSRAAAYIQKRAAEKSQSTFAG